MVRSTIRKHLRKTGGSSITLAAPAEDVLVVNNTMEDCGRSYAPTVPPSRDRTTFVLF